MSGLFSTPDYSSVQEEEAEAPTEDTEAVKKAQKKKAAQIAARSGRTSTILTQRKTDMLGGEA